MRVSSAVWQVVLLQPMVLPQLSQISFAYLRDVVILIAHCATLSIHSSRCDGSLLRILEVVACECLGLDVRRLLPAPLGQLLRLLEALKRIGCLNRQVGVLMNFGLALSSHVLAPGALREERILYRATLADWPVLRNTQWVLVDRHQESLACRRVAVVMRI